MSNQLRPRLTRLVQELVNEVRKIGNMWIRHHNDIHQKSNANSDWANSTAKIDVTAITVASDQEI